jgi:hypothetical protein
MGLLGAAVAWDLTQAASLAMMASYCVYHTRRQAPAKCTWGGWTLEAFEGWGQYITMAVPSMVMICERGRGRGRGRGWVGDGASCQDRQRPGLGPSPSLDQDTHPSTPRRRRQAWTGGRLR